jgi:hypothetical protein
MLVLRYIWLLACLLSLPAEAARCRDGTYSNSSGRGACAHHGGVAPDPVTPKNYVPAAPSPVLGSSLGASVGNTGSTEEESTARYEPPTFLLLLFPVISIVGIAVFFYLANARVNKRDAERAKIREEQEADERESLEAELSPLIAALNENPVVGLAFARRTALMLGAEEYPQSGKDVVLAVVPVTLYRPQKITSGVTYGSISKTVNVGGLFRVRLGHVKGLRHATEELRPQGTGSLVITSKGVMYDADGHGANWSRTWRGLLKVDALADALVVEANSGKPWVFSVRSSQILHHPVYLSALCAAAQDTDAMNQVKGMSDESIAEAFGTLGGEDA